MSQSPHSQTGPERIKLASKLRQLSKEMTEGDPKTAAMLILAAKAIERQPAGPHEPAAIETLKQQLSNAHSQITKLKRAAEHSGTPSTKKGDWFGPCGVCGGALLWYVNHRCKGPKPCATEGTAG